MIRRGRGEMNYLLMVGLAFLGVICPIFNTEVSFLALSYKVHNIFVLAAAATVGSTGGYILLYYLGMGSRKMSRKLKEKVESINIEKFRKSSVIVLATASLVSIPPVTPLCIVAGTLRYDLRKYVVVILLCRMIKYTIIGLFYDSIHAALLDVLHVLEEWGNDMLELFHEMGGGK
jgi:membrane protein YqaA with SNARE-associated domain